VLAIAPGTFDTPMLAGLPPRTRSRALAADIPFPHRVGEPGEYGDLVAHIVANRYLNGEVIRLDGAMRIAGEVALRAGAPGWFTRMVLRRAGRRRRG